MPLAAAITGGFGLLNGAVSAVGQKYAADRYLEGVQQTNEQNYKIWQEQQQHNLDMFNVQNDANVRNWQNQFDQTNAYNTALAQRQRLEEAGINPAMMMQGGNAGVASSSGIPTATAQPANAPQMQAPGFVESPLVAFAQTAIQSLQGISQALKFNAETRTEEATRDPIVERIISEKEKNVSEKVLNLAKVGTEHYNKYFRALETREKELEIEYNEKTLETRVQLQDQILQHTIQQRIGQQLSNEAQAIINEFLPAQQQANVALTTYNALKAYYEGQLTKEEVVTEVKKQILIGAQTATEYEKQRTEKALQGFYQTGSALNVANASKAYAEGNKANVEAKGKEIENYKVASTAEAFISATNSAYFLEYQTTQHELEWRDNWWYKGTKIVGDGLRNAVGGIISGSVSRKSGGPNK